MRVLSFGCATSRPIFWSLLCVRRQALFFCLFCCDDDVKPKIMHRRFKRTAPASVLTLRVRHGQPKHCQQTWEHRLSHFIVNPRSSVPSLHDVQRSKRRWAFRSFSVYRCRVELFVRIFVWLVLCQYFLFAYYPVLSGVFESDCVCAHTSTCVCTALFLSFCL